MMRSRLIATALVGLAFALAAPPTVAQPLLTNPQWIERPTGDDFVRYYPAAALSQNVVGRAVLECIVAVDGRVSCEVVEEAPEGWGFGEGAVGISRSFRMAAQTRDGAPSAGGRIRVPIRFSLGGPVELPAEMPPELRNLISAAAREVPPVWEAAPSYEAVLAAYPPEARRRGIRGRGVLSCRINEDRTLACEGLRETPEGHGFLSAAMQLSHQFRVAEPAEGDERPREPLLLPINFGASPMETPVGQFYSGLEPLPLPPPAPIVIAALYPAEALRNGVEGRASVLCRMDDTGSISACAIEREDPTGRGFGEAVLSWARRVPLNADDLGIIPGDEVRATVVFAGESLGRSP